MQDRVLFVVLVGLTTSVMEIHIRHVGGLFARCGLDESPHTAGGKQI